VRGGWETHFAKVIGLPNMARWDFFIVFVISPSLSTKAKEMEEASPEICSGQRIHLGGIMKFSLAQIGFRISSCMSCSSVYIASQSGSETGVPWKITRDHPEQGARMPPGKGCRRICETWEMRAKGMSPANV
jgi:hypothetical protein